jgi:SAM-dependent methyltransferase
MASRTDEGYLLDNRQSEAGERFDALSRMFDESTFRHLEAAGVAAGWRCWEVGAGGSSVPRWLAGRVGPTGSVLATDIDIRWLDPDGGFEVLRHDVALDSPPGGGFDLVHARAVLTHVPGRDRALASMAGALRPGGVLVVEDVDPEMQPLSCPDEQTDEHRRANRLRRGFRTLLARRGADVAYGRTLPRRLRAAGLTDVRADAYFPLDTPDCADLEAATVRLIRDDLIAAGLATAAEIDRHLEYVAGNPGQFATSAMVTARGRKPSS